MNVEEISQTGEEENPQRGLSYAWIDFDLFLTVRSVLDLAYSVGFCVSVYSYIVCWVSGLCTFPSKSPWLILVETIWYALVITFPANKDSFFCMRIIQFCICCHPESFCHFYTLFFPTHTRFKMCQKSKPSDLSLIRAHNAFAKIQKHVWCESSLL